MNGGFEMTEAEKKKMQEQGAIGNSPVETKKGGVNAEPVLKSPNEPQVDMQPFMQQVAGPAEQIKSNEDIATARKTYLESDEGKAAKEAAEKEVANAANREFLEYKPTEWNREKANAELQKDATFLDILKNGQKQADEYKARIETARNNAKYNALGNLLVSLGQIAGGGKQTYVKPTTGKYLTDSMAKADEARKMYDAVLAQKEAAENRYKQAFMDRSQQQHMQTEKLKQQAIKDYNDVLQKGIAESNKNAIEIAKLELDRAYKSGQISNQQYANETARLNAITNQGKLALDENEYNFKTYKEEEDAKKNAFVRYEDGNGTGYIIDKPKAIEVANILVNKKIFTPEQLGLTKAPVYGSNDTKIIKDEAELQRKVLDYISKNPNDADIQKMLQGARMYQYDKPNLVERFKTDAKNMTPEELAKAMQELGYTQKKDVSNSGI